MPFCPKCGCEFERGILVCSDDGEPLVESLPEEQPIEEDNLFPVDEGELTCAMVTESSGSAEMVAEFLNAQGIAAVTINKEGSALHAYHASPEFHVMVTEKNAEAAIQMIRDYFADDVEDVSGTEDASRAAEAPPLGARPRAVEGSGKKTLLGAATFCSFVYLSVMLTLLIHFRSDLMSFHHLLNQTKPLHLLILPILIFLNGYYTLHLHFSDRVPRERKAAWIVAMLLFQSFSWPFYFYTFIWNNPDPKKNPSGYRR